MDMNISIAYPGSLEFKEKGHSRSFILLWRFLKDEKRCKSTYLIIINNCSNFQFVYLRELNLERLNRATVEQLSRHRKLKKLIVHGCRNYEVLQDFHTLPQLLVVKGEIIGLKQMIGDMDPMMMIQSPQTTVSPINDPPPTTRLDESISTSSGSVSDSESSSVNQGRRSPYIVATE